MVLNFNPRSPYRERRNTFSGMSGNVINFNPRSPYRERRYVTEQSHMLKIISIHAPHTGSDKRSNIVAIGNGISTHAPHTGSDVGTPPHFLNLFQFQSTLPIQGATMDNATAIRVEGISIHAPHTGSDRLEHIENYGLAISIHAPHTGSDTRHSVQRNYRLFISIHAPHTGSD